MSFRPPKEIQDNLKLLQAQAKNDREREKLEREAREREARERKAQEAQEERERKAQEERERKAREEQEEQEAQETENKKILNQLNKFYNQVVKLEDIGKLESLKTKIKKYTEQNIDTIIDEGNDNLNNTADKIYEKIVKKKEELKAAEELKEAAEAAKAEKAEKAAKAEKAEKTEKAAKAAAKAAAAKAKATEKLSTFLKKNKDIEGIDEIQKLKEEFKKYTTNNSESSKKYFITNAEKIAAKINVETRKKNVEILTKLKVFNDKVKTLTDIGELQSLIEEINTYITSITQDTITKNKTIKDGVKSVYKNIEDTITYLSSQQTLPSTTSQSSTSSTTTPRSRTPKKAAAAASNISAPPTTTPPSSNTSAPNTAPLPVPTSSKVQPPSQPPSQPTISSQLTTATEPTTPPSSNTSAPNTAPLPVPSPSSPEPIKLTEASATIIQKNVRGNQSRKAALLRANAAAAAVITPPVLEKDERQELKKNIDEIYDKLYSFSELVKVKNIKEFKSWKDTYFETLISQYNEQKSEMEKLLDPILENIKNPSYDLKEIRKVFLVFLTKLKIFLTKALELFLVSQLYERQNDQDKKINVIQTKLDYFKQLLIPDTKDDIKQNFLTFMNEIDKVHDFQSEKNSLTLVTLGSIPPQLR